MKSDSHISDQDLLRAADGELSSREATRIQAHLEACWKCRARRAELDRTIEEFVVAHHSNNEADLPRIEGPQALLRARLRQIQAVEPVSSWRRFRQSVYYSRGPLYAGVALGIVGAIGLAMYWGVEKVRADSIPDSSLTPGATRTATKEDVCLGQTMKGFYPIPATLAYRVFEKYRIRNPRPRSYEVDYLITPALGGADDIRNLWPQPYGDGEWNAHAKDALEDYLHKMVCTGELNLETAQHDIAVNWIAAYKKYFRTDHPLADHSNFSIDAPWED